MFNKLNACILFVLIFCVKISNAQNDFSSAIEKSSFSLDSLQAEGYLLPVKDFSKILENNKVFAVGEATHGVKNTVDIRYAFVKMLVSELNYKVIVSETDFSSTLSLNDYVLYGKGSAKEALKLMGYWMYNNQDFLNLVEWVRKFNDTKDIAEKVRFYGADMTAPAILTDIIRGNYLPKTFTTDIRIKDALDKLRMPSSKSFTKEEEGLISNLKDKIKAEMASLPESNLSRISLNTILQVSEYRSLGSGTLSSALRDRSMFENITSIMKTEPGRKVIFLAHNLHITKKLILPKREPVGQLLSKALGSSYYALGLLFLEGEFLANDRSAGGFKVFSLKAPGKEFFESQFSSPNKNDIFIDFKKSEDDKLLSETISRKWLTRQVGATFSDSKADLEKSSFEIKPYECFDGMVIFKKTFALTLPFRWND